MKELDLVLLRYLEQDYPAASAAERDAFARILDLQDPETLRVSCRPCRRLRTTPCTMSSPGSAMTVELPRWTLADRLAAAARRRRRRRPRGRAVAVTRPRRSASASSRRRARCLATAALASAPPGRRARRRVSARSGWVTAGGYPAGLGRGTRHPRARPSCCTGRQPGRSAAALADPCRPAPAKRCAALRSGCSPAARGRARERAGRSVAGSMTPMANFPPSDGSTEPHEPRDDAARPAIRRRAERPRTRQAGPAGRARRVRPAGPQVPAQGREARGAVVA